jgi:hypothetical protein
VRLHPLAADAHPIRSNVEEKGVTGLERASLPYALCNRDCALLRPNNHGEDEKCSNKAPEEPNRAGRQPTLSGGGSRRPKGQHTSRK